MMKCTRQRADVAVEVVPARLREPDPRVVEDAPFTDQPTEEIRSGQEIGIEDGDQLASRTGQAGCQRAGLVTCAVGAVYPFDTNAASARARHRPARDLGRVVGRIIQHLDVQLVARIILRRCRRDDPFSEVALVEQRDLDGDGG